MDEEKLEIEVRDKAPVISPPHLLSEQRMNEVIPSSPCKSWFISLSIFREMGCFKVNPRTASFIRISALSLADRITAYAMFVVVDYLTDVWELSTTYAAAITNVWNGITPILGIMATFFVDAFTGEFYMLAFSSIVLDVGLGLLFMSAKLIGQCKVSKDYEKECIGQTQEALFYTALMLIAVGMAGYASSLKTFLDLQTKIENENENENSNIEKGNGNGNENNKENEKNVRKSGKGNKIFKRIMVWTKKVALGLFISIFGSMLYALIRERWSLWFGIPCICSAVATLIFFTGWPYDKHNKPEGSPLTTILRVLVATTRNIWQPTPDPQDLDEDNTHSTSSLRFFEKAAIRLPDEQQPKKWKVCNVREVEDTKICIRMIPMWLTFIVIGIILSTGNTYYLEQADQMDTKLGKIKVPILFIFFFKDGMSFIFAKIYTFLTPPTKKYGPTLGIITSMYLSVICCMIAATVETRRLHLIRDHGLLDEPDEMIPMSIFALCPQVALLGIVDGIANKSIEGFFRQQVPDSMHRYVTHFTKGVLGLGTMASALSVYVVWIISERNGKTNWFLYSLNESRLDHYYWVLAGLSFANIGIYLVVASIYKYKELPNDDGTRDDNGENIDTDTADPDR